MNTLDNILSPGNVGELHIMVVCVVCLRVAFLSTEASTPRGITTTITTPREVTGCPVGVGMGIREDVNYFGNGSKECNVTLSKYLYIYSEYVLLF